jgi:hypothetical protein
LAVKACQGKDTKVPVLISFMLLYWFTHIFV